MRTCQVGRREEKTFKVKVKFACTSNCDLCMPLDWNVTKDGAFEFVFAIRLYSYFCHYYYTKSFWRAFHRAYWEHSARNRRSICTRKTSRGTASPIDVTQWTECLYHQSDLLKWGPFRGSIGNATHLAFKNKIKYWSCTAHKLAARWNDSYWSFHRFIDFKSQNEWPKGLSFVGRINVPGPYPVLIAQKVTAPLSVADHISSVQFIVLFINVYILPNTKARDSKQHTDDCSNPHRRTRRQFCYFTLVILHGSLNLAHFLACHDVPLGLGLVMYPDSFSGYRRVLTEMYGCCTLLLHLFLVLIRLVYTVALKDSVQLYSDKIFQSFFSFFHMFRT